MRVIPDRYGGFARLDDFIEGHEASAPNFVGLFDAAGTAAFAARRMSLRFSSRLDFVRAAAFKPTP